MTFPGPVLVIGCGLIGTSIGLALTQNGSTVHVADIDRVNVELAVARGAGVADPVTSPVLVVVAVPPQFVAATVSTALADYPQAVVTDVASVKSGLQAELAAVPGVERYVGSHPMAGNERSGPLGATALLFEGRPWAVTGNGAKPEAIELVVALATACGAVPLQMDASSHDRGVAFVSHVPYLLSVLAAARLTQADDEHTALAGPGVRDVTRVAASDAALWRDILRSNAVQVREVLADVRDDLDTILHALDHDDAALIPVLESGRAGTKRIPVKHGERLGSFAVVNVSIADRPGELARLFALTEQSEVNIEDLRIEHELGRPVGLVELMVLEDMADALVEELIDHGWSAYR